MYSYIRMNEFNSKEENFQFHTILNDYSGLAKRVDGQYQSSEKIIMPACTLDKELLNFACPMQVLVQFLYTVDTFAWALAHWASEIEQVLAW